MHIEGSRSNLYSVTNDVDPGQLQSSETYKEEIKLLQNEIETLKAKYVNASDHVEPIVTKEVSEKAEDKVVEIHEDILAHVSDARNAVVDNGDSRSLGTQTSGISMSKSEEVLHELSVVSTNNDNCMENKESLSKPSGQQLTEDNVLPVKADNPCDDEAVFGKVNHQFLTQFTFESGFYGANIGLRCICFLLLGSSCISNACPKIFHVHLLSLHVNLSNLDI